MHRAWLEIDVTALAHNINEVRKIIAPETKIMAIVKADGYGHGAPMVSKVFLENGASYLGVSTVQEACQLSEAGITAPILILTHTVQEQIETVITHSFRQTISTWDQAVILSRKATRLSKRAVIHIKLDTGMGRLGFLPLTESLKIIENISSLPGLFIEGIFTHFSSADCPDKTYTEYQWCNFSKFISQLEEKKLSFPLKHAANSAAIIDHPQTHSDMVRAGIMLYGLQPSPATNKEEKINLWPAITLKAKVSYVKEVGPGESLSYGRTYITTHRQRIATLPIGYADGLSRLLSNKIKFLIHGQHVPVVGQICMDQCLLDVTMVKPDVLIGDEVVLIGKQGTREVSADDWANLLGTINYEVVTRFGPRIPKYYHKSTSLLNSQAS